MFKERKCRCYRRGKLLSPKFDDNGLIQLLQLTLILVGLMHGYMNESL